ncbi:hypothetical protein BDP27DRAFT_1403081 [Rhodocollybia butyracea]|uniref:Uncharacterized protein n=1 Tax=Rhodocollybia butyracea TaxID=206335 RepID=A0A9P5U7D1_9AGAR|nr:hypothetical protein BDP27DRAFT_1403081 [Rhodocollybia butyracea]
MSLWEKFYFPYLAFSLLSVALFDALKPQQDSTIDAALIVLLPFSVGVSIWLLRRCTIQISSPLPRYWRHAPNHNDKRRVTESVEHSLVLLGFFHALLMSMRLLGIVFYGSPSEHRWAPIGLPFTMVFIAAYGKCLFLLGIQEYHWGYFRDVYWVLTLPIQFVLYIFHFLADLCLAESV